MWRVNPSGRFAMQSNLQGFALRIHSFSYINSSRTERKKGIPERNRGVLSAELQDIRLASERNAFQVRGPLKGSPAYRRAPELLGRPLKYSQVERNTGAGIRLRAFQGAPN